MKLSTAGWSEKGQQTDSLADLVLETEYRSGESDLVRDFYVPCLERSAAYDRAVGFFRSTILVVAGSSIVDFALRGGRLRLVCSPSFSESDIEALSQGYDRRREVASASLVREVEALLANEANFKHTEVLATLVAAEALDIRVAVRPPSHGPYHEKIGIFRDVLGNEISFRGSSNETWSGWDVQGNLESFEVFCSWRGDAEAERIQKHTTYFERLWENRVPDLDVIPFPAAARSKLIEVALASIEDLIDRPDPPIEPFPHQAEAIKNWREQGSRGILEHATGSGKTITAIMAIKDVIEQGGVPLVVVPGSVLFEQWSSEIDRFLPTVTVLGVGAGRQAWRRDNRLQHFTAPVEESPARLVLATLQTARTEEFRAAISDGDHLFLIADEVHRTGSPENSQIFRIDSGPRLGLSATPKRFGDPEGTRRMIEYFGGIVQPPFTLNDAINAGRLVNYRYFPHLVGLTEAESIEWATLTRRIAAAIGQQHDDEGSFVLSAAAKLLLIRRSRIAKKAESKVDLVERVLEEHYARDQRWLVYCEDMDQLGVVLGRVRSMGIESAEYHYQMEGDPAATLSWLREIGGVLVSIRCLDEGVDIPNVSHALILASSQNPRQFIQRRGRVLRVAPGKTIAEVHDALVLPDDLESEPEQVSLVRGELARALEFAKSALNRSVATDLLGKAIDLGVEIATFESAGMEEESNGE